MSNYKPLQQKKPIKKCIRCDKVLDFFGFSQTYCVDCSVLRHEQKRKDEDAMRKAYCPFCQMLLAEHKQDEAQKCLYNLRGYVDVSQKRESET